MNFLNEEKEKFSWGQIIEALTDESKVLNFPIKYPAIDFDKPTKNMFYITAGIISAGFILAAIIKKNGKKT
jgi:hypothetical protein